MLHNEGKRTELKGGESFGIKGICGKDSAIGGGKEKIEGGRGEKAWGLKR